MPKLLLVKHSISNHNPLQTPAEWELTDDGVNRCGPLARHIGLYRPRQLYSSPMPKALQTAQFVSTALGELPIHVNHQLAEHRRESNAPYGSQSEFNLRIKRLFDEPDNLVFGDETGNQARERFQRGIVALLKQTDKPENTVVIAHGTVIVLFAAQYNAIDSYDLWRRLKMPSLLELNLPDFRIAGLIEDAGRC